MKNLETFWDRKHKEQDKNLLSGCYFDETIDFLQVRNNIKPNIKILEIGVGFGYVTEGLSKIGKVSCIDISEVALNNVKPLCENVFHSSQTKNLPKNYFDLAICHNVVQHVPTKELKEELTDIVSSLTTTGTLALEFVSNGVEDTGNNYNEKAATYGWLYRTVDFMKDLVNECGGTSECVYSGSAIKKKTSLTVHVFHVRKKQNV